MNKFLVFPCTIKENSDGYNGPVITLVCESTTGLAIFFPVSEENAKVINTVLEKPVNKLDINVGNIIGVYKTMVDSWNSGGRFLSGISMDAEFDQNDKTEIISVKVIISDVKGGYVENVIKVNFIHAIIIAAMYKFEIIVSKDLLEKLLPKIDDDEDENLENNSKIEKIEKADSKKFPKDKQILKIAKKIMNGKIK